MEDAMNVIIITLNKSEIVTIYTGSLEYEFQNARFAECKISQYCR